MSSLHSTRWNMTMHAGKKTRNANAISTRKTASKNRDAATHLSMSVMEGKTGGMLKSKLDVIHAREDIRIEKKNIFNPL